MSNNKISRKNKRGKNIIHNAPFKLSSPVIGPDNIDLDEMNRMMTAMMLYRTGFTPGEYKAFYEDMKQSGVDAKLSDDEPTLLEIIGRLAELEKKEAMFDQQMSAHDDADNDDDADDFDDPKGANIFRADLKSTKKASHAAPEALPDAENLTLTLEVELEVDEIDPIVRVVDVPGEITFSTLAMILNTVVGWDNYHLHAFNAKKGRAKVSIGEPNDWTEYDCDEAVTPITSFLRKKGNKIEYEYDFGDGWSHIVKVSEVKPKTSDFPVMISSRGGRVVEDNGGPWGLARLHRIASGRGRLSAEDRLEIESFGMDSRKELKAWLAEDPDIEEINETLPGVM